MCRTIIPLAIITAFISTANGVNFTAPVAVPAAPKGLVVPSNGKAKSYFFIMPFS